MTIDPNAVKAQIGIGNLMAVGAREWRFEGESALTFRVGSGRGHIKMIIVRLDPDDTYTVRYTETSARTYALVNSREISDVYAEQLGQIVYSMVNK